MSAYPSPGRDQRKITPHACIDCGTAVVDNTSPRCPDCREAQLRARNRRSYITDPGVITGDCHPARCQHFPTCQARIWDASFTPPCAARSEE